MAIADRFYTNGYNQEFELELDDRDGKPSGLKVWVYDMECDAAVEVENLYAAKTTGVNIKHVKIDGDNISTDVPSDLAGQLWQDRARDKYAACIARWDFNGEGLFSDDEGEPECTYENKLAVLRIPGVGAQIIKKIDEISGFTKPLKKG